MIPETRRRTTLGRAARGDFPQPRGRHLRALRPARRDDASADGARTARRRGRQSPVIVYEPGPAQVRAGEELVAGRRIAGRLLPYGAFHLRGPRFDPVARRLVPGRTDAAVPCAPPDPRAWREALARLPPGPVLVGPGSPAEPLRGSLAARRRGGGGVGSRRLPARSASRRCRRRPGSSAPARGALRLAPGTRRRRIPGPGGGGSGGPAGGGPLPAHPGLDRRDGADPDPRGRRRRSRGRRVRRTGAGPLRRGEARDRGLAGGRRPIRLGPVLRGDPPRRLDRPASTSRSLEARRQASARGLASDAAEAGRASAARQRRGRRASRGGRRALAGERAPRLAAARRGALDRRVAPRPRRDRSRGQLPADLPVVAARSRSESEAALLAEAEAEANG